VTWKRALGVIWLKVKDFKKVNAAVKLLFVVFTSVLLQACTVLAVADVAASTVVYGVKTTVNVIDAVTPDIVNKKKETPKN
jgi:hypothetical protein